MVPVPSLVLFLSLLAAQAGSITSQGEVCPSGYTVAHQRLYDGLASTGFGESLEECSERCTRRSGCTDFSWSPTYHRKPNPTCTTFIGSKVLGPQDPGFITCRGNCTPHPRMDLTPESFTHIPAAHPGASNAGIPDISSSNDCALLCRGVQECATWVHDTANHTCWLSSQASNLTFVNSEHRVAGMPCAYVEEPRGYEFLFDAGRCSGYDGWLGGWGRKGRDKMEDPVAKESLQACVDACDRHEDCQFVSFMRDSACLRWSRALGSCVKEPFNFNYYTYRKRDTPALSPTSRAVPSNTPSPTAAVDEPTAPSQASIRDSSAVSSPTSPPASPPTTPTSSVTSTTPADLLSPPSSTSEGSASGGSTFAAARLESMLHNITGSTRAETKAVEDISAAAVPWRLIRYMMLCTVLVHVFMGSSEP